MFRFVPLLFALLFVGCNASAESRLESAISAADKNKAEVFRGFLDENSRTLLDQLKKEAKFLDDEWIFMDGAPHQLLQGAKIISSEQISGSTVRVKIGGTESGIETLWMLKTGSSLFPEWEVHLLSSPELFSHLRLER